MLELLDNIAKDGKLVIAVTHSQEVADHGTRIVHLADGKIDGDKTLRPKYEIPSKPTHITSQPLPASASYRSSFKHLMYYFWRNSLIMLGTAIGIFAVLLFSGLGNGINGYIQNQINSVANPRVINVFKNTTGKKMTREQTQQSMRTMATNPQSMTISNHNLKRIQKLKGVSSAQPGIVVSAFQLTYDKKPQNVSSLSTWNKGIQNNTIKQGHKPKDNEILLTKQAAIQMTSAKKYKNLVGKKVNITFSWIDQNNNPVQIHSRLKVSGISDGTSAANAVKYSTMTNMLKNNNANHQANNVTVTVKDLNDVKPVAKKINNLRNSNHKRVLSSITVGSVLNRVNTYVKLASIVLSAIAGISLLVSALMIIVTMYMSVSERTKEIGILRALGESKTDIRRLFTSESILIGLFSAVLALVLVVIATLIINNALYGTIKYNIIQVTFGNVVFAFVIAIVISFIAALLPARRAATLNPIDALAAD